MSARHRKLGASFDRAGTTPSRCFRLSVGTSGSGSTAFARRMARWSFVSSFVGSLLVGAGAFGQSQNDSRSLSDSRDWYRQPQGSASVSPAGASQAAVAQSAVAQSAIAQSAIAQSAVAQADPSRPPYGQVPAPAAAVPAPASSPAPAMPTPAAAPAAVPGVPLPPANVAPPADQSIFAPPATVGRPYQMPPIGNPYNGYGSVSGIYPSSEMNSFVIASARAATARALYRQAESELGLVTRAAQRSHDGSQEVREAMKEEKDAWLELSNARSKSLASLDSDKRYQRLLALWQDLVEKIQDGRARKTLGPDEITAMAQLKLSYATEMHVIEADTMGNDASIRDAQARLVAAGARLSALRQQFDDSMRLNPEVLMARRNVADARIACLTAEAYLRAAAMNGSYAMDYSYYLYRDQPNRGIAGLGY